MDFVKRKLSQITGFKGVEIVNRGNSAIFSAFDVAKNINPKNIF